MIKARKIDPLYLINVYFKFVRGCEEAPDFKCLVFKFVRGCEDIYDKNGLNC